MKKKISSSNPIPEFEESLERMTPDSRIFVDKSLAIAHYLQVLMRHQGLRQKDLATLLNKSEAEISKWLTGMHNYTLRSLAKLEAAMGTDIISIPETVEVATPQITQSASLRMEVNRRQEPAGMKELSYSKPSVEANENNNGDSHPMAA